MSGKRGGFGDRSAHQEDVRATLNDALDLLPPRGRIAMLHQLLAKAVCAMIEGEAYALAMRMPSQSTRPWMPVHPRVTKRQAMVTLVTERPGISTIDVAQALGMQKSSCGASLSQARADGLIQNRAGGWYPAPSKPGEESGK